MTETFLSAYNPKNQTGTRKNFSQTIEFKKTLTVFGNLAVILWIMLGSLAFWLYNQLAGWLFLITAIIAIYGILKFLGCLRPCYNCKKCTYGLGRISALFFGKRSLKDHKESYGMPSAVFSNALLGPFPAIFLFISIVQSFTIFKIVVLFGLLTISLYSILSWRTTRKT